MKALMTLNSTPPHHDSLFLLSLVNTFGEF